MKEFIDEYKRLEKLCSEIYGQQHGISRYIADMEKSSTYAARGIPGWSSDLANLKRVRHIRNKMVHDAEDYDDAYEPEDLAFIKQFHQRILTQQDPLALRRQLEQNAAKVNQKTSHVPADVVQNIFSLKTDYPDFEYNSDNTNFDKRKRLEREDRVLKRMTTATVILIIIVLLILIKLYWN